MQSLSIIHSTQILLSFSHFLFPFTVHVLSVVHSTQKLSLLPLNLKESIKLHAGLDAGQSFDSVTDAHYSLQTLSIEHFGFNGSVHPLVKPVHS